MHTVPDLLDFEAAHPRHNGRKEHAIRVRFDITPARYYQLLIRAAISPEGAQHDPITARRILATTNARQTTRKERRFR